VGTAVCGGRSEHGGLLLLRQQDDVEEFLALRSALVPTLIYWREMELIHGFPNGKHTHILHLNTSRGIKPSRFDGNEVDAILGADLLSYTCREVQCE